MAKPLKATIEISAVDQASQVVKKIGKEFDVFGKQLEKTKSRVGSVFSGVGAAGLGALGGGIGLGAIVGQAGEFENALYQTTKVTTDSTESIKQKILELPASLGSSTDLTQGYYQVLSAGVTDASMAMDTLTTSAKLSAVAGTTQGESIQALTKMMAGYRGEIDKVSTAADLLLDIEELGQATVKELIPLIGDLSGLSQTLGVNYKEMAAAMALLTQTAGSPAQAATQLRALEIALIKPTENMQKLLGAMGYKNGQELMAQNGLAGSLELIRAGAQKSGMEVSKFLESSEALIAFNAIATGGFGKYTEILSQVGTATGRTEESFNKFLEIFKGVEATGIATFKNLSSIVGDVFLPDVKDALTEFSTYISNNTEQVRSFATETQTSLSGIKDNIASIIDVWKSLPDDITGPAGYGIVGGILFGKTGAVLGLALSVASAVQNSIAGARAVANGQITFGEYATANKQELDALLKRKDPIAEAQKKQQDEYNKYVKRQYATTNRLELPALLINNKPAAEAQKKQQGKANDNTNVPRQNSAQPAQAALPTLPKNFKPIGAKSGGAGKADSAMLYLKGINAEIEKMLGTGESFDIKLDKKLDEIARSAKGAGLSLAETKKIQEEYAQAANGERERNQAKAIDEVDASIARMTGDLKRARDIELTREIDELSKKFTELGVPVDVATQKIDAFRSAKLKESSIRDASAAAQFYKELAQLSGDFGASTEYNNELLKLQAENFRINAGVSQEMADQWQRLMQLETARDPFSGLERGMRKYVADATDYASQFESAWSGAMSGFEDAIVTAVTTGKISFSDLANSILADMTRMAAKQALGGIMGGVTNILGSAFDAMLGGGGTTGVSTGIGSPSWINPGMRHSGGQGSGPPYYNSPLPMAMFASAPRLHTGGGKLAPNEYPAVLLNSERVLNPAETRAYNAAMALRPQPTLAPVQSSNPTVVNNFIITPPSGYEAQEERKPNNQGGEDIKIVFSRMMAAEAGSYGSPLNKSLRAQGLRTPVVRQG